MTTASKLAPNPSASRLAGERAISAPFSTEPPVIVRADWRGFYDLDELPRMSGATLRDLAKLVAKELADNALDAAGSCEVGRLSGNGLFVQNPGDMPCDARGVAGLFSVARPQTSTKMYRLPCRGALGNGLRVVAGAVYASGGRLVVRTGGQVLGLVPQDDGSTAATLLGAALPGLTRVEVTFGPSIPVGPDALESAELAVLLAPPPTPTKKRAQRPSIHWHNLDSFLGLLRDADGAPSVRQMVERFDGLSGINASKACGGLSGLASVVSKSRADAAELFETMRGMTEPPTHDALGRVGDLPGWKRPSREEDWVKLNGVRIPFRVEAWARPAEGFSITVCVNRTPCPGKIALRAGSTKQNGRSVRKLAVTGLGVSECVGGSCSNEVAVLVNIQCPKLPVVDNGKSPNLRPIWGAVGKTIGAAIKKTKGTATKPPGAAVSQKDMIRGGLTAAAREVSDDGRLEYNLRNLFYSIRPQLLDALGREPIYGTFADVIGEYEDEEDEHGVKRELPGLCRDNRGMLYEPHTGKEMPLGTRTARAYSRPPLLFNKILYCEKEGFFPQLIADAWPERHDCALVTGKGFAPRAVGELLKVMGDTGEDLTIFCVHDADGPGTVIYDALRKGASKRAGRYVEVIDLGLNPAEAVAMSLPSEPVVRATEDRVPTGETLEPEWKDWLQTRRIELNAIVPVKRFIEWLDQKMVGHVGKVQPPAGEVAARLAAQTAERLREQITADILQAADLNGRVASALARLAPVIEQGAAKLAGGLPHELAAPRPEHWTRFVDNAARAIAAGSKPHPASPES